MYYSKFSRDKIIDLLSGKDIPSRSQTTIEIARNSILSFKGHDLLLLWDDAGDKPPVIVAPDDKFLETLAFVATYIRNVSPFTAFFRVIPAADLGLPIFSRERSFYRPLDHRLVGVAIAEAFLQLPNEPETVDSISIQSGMATLSASLLKALSLDASDRTLTQISRRWEKSRALLKLDSLRTKIDTIEEFWSVMALSLGYERTYTKSNLPLSVFHIVKDYTETGVLTNEHWQTLTMESPSLRNKYLELTGAREDAINTFKKLVLNIVADSNDSRMNDILIGAALSLLASGSMSYLPLTRILADDHPVASLWFAFFVSLHPKSDVLFTGDGLGAHLVKRIFDEETVFDSPKSDISFPELEMLVNQSDENLRFRTEHSTSISVELSPLVSGRFRISREFRRSEPTGNVPVPLEEWAEAQSLLRRALAIMARRPESLNQPQLFPSSSAVRKRKRS